ncbi:molybdopterin-synthase adenylyltransferase MoeB [Halalkalibaculum sp. DA3122]
MKDWQNMEFSPEELGHYSRHLSIPEFGMEGQKKLKAASVLAVGTGGLGAPMLQYLAAAGVGTIGLVDFDVIEASNLHRQVLFGASDVGRKKVEVAKERLREINPHITINVHETRLTSDNALEIIEDYDVIADGTDNFPTRYLINDACVMLDKPNVHGSIFQFEGQVSVFNYLDKEGNRGPNYRDLFPEPPPPGLVPSCAEAGVLGVLPGIIGCIQASEVIKVITGIGELLAGKLFLFDALNFSTRTVKVQKNPDNPLTGDDPEITELIDYQEFCGLPPLGEEEDEQQESEVPEVTVAEYKSWVDNGEDVQLIDVREPYEAEIAEIGGELIPLDHILDQADKIDRQKKVVVHCRSGQRSADAIKKLREKYGFDNLYNLKGGILAWSEEIDESVPQY